MSKTIAAKSDQLNADDLIGAPMTLTITRVTKGAPDQPVHIFYEGGGKKSFRPCKSMRRVLANIWGPDGTSYVGRSLVVFRDPDVKYGGESVGGVRISHMSGINGTTQTSLIVTRGRRSLYTVQPLRVDVQTPQERQEDNEESTAQQEADTLAERVRSAQEAADRAINAMNTAADMKALEKINLSERYKNLIGFVEKHDKATFEALKKSATDNAHRISESEFA
ncbi:hypothetical protein [Komagataeibacter oboediens]|uniref:hypothetical protein n=1 Tax=Komagataeibacter oboediens TaxID=65958 RepID=UPI0023DA0F27|nr:hypothetical protein [Komagataeibacter oboediens]